MKRLLLPVDTVGPTISPPCTDNSTGIPLTGQKYSLFVQHSDIYNQQVILCSRFATLKISNIQTFRDSGESSPYILPLFSLDDNRQLFNTPSLLRYSIKRERWEMKILAIASIRYGNIVTIRAFVSCLPSDSFAI